MAALDQVKPKLRGWLHLGAFPLVVVAGTALVALAPAGRARVACAIFAGTAAVLFGTSALYHRGNWSPRTEKLLKRLDHSNIFLIIAGSYTPFTILLLPPDQARVLLWIVWSGALAGVAFRVFWVGAPRWLYTPAYVALGWLIAWIAWSAIWSGARAARSASASASMSHAPTLAPSAAVFSASSRPNPLAAPVTMMVRPSRWLVGALTAGFPTGTWR